MRRLLMRHWTDADVEVLTELIAQHEPVWRIARRLHRSESSVRSKLVKLDIGIARDTLTLRKMRRAVFASVPRDG